MNKDQIISILPYKEPFLFVDQLLDMDENGAKGIYTFKDDEYFYQGHFPGNPVTPGVILTETMAQIGLVCLGIYLGSQSGLDTKQVKPVFTSAHVDFLAPVLPGELVEVTSSKIYYRFSKLKCSVELFNKTQNQLACRGELSGIISS